MRIIGYLGNNVQSKNAMGGFVGGMEMSECFAKEMRSIIRYY